MRNSLAPVLIAPLCLLLFYVLCSRSPFEEVNTLRNAEKHHEAILILDEKIKDGMGSSQADAYHIRSHCYTSLYDSAMSADGGDITIETQELIDRALADANAAIELNEYRPFWYTERAQIYTDLGNYEISIENNLMAAHLDSNITDPYVGLGFGYRMLKKHERAIWAYTNLVRAGNYVGSVDIISIGYEFRGHAYVETGNYNQAIKDYIASIENCLFPWRAYEAIGNLHRDHLIPDSSLAYYDKALVDGLIDYPGQEDNEDTAIYSDEMERSVYLNRSKAYKKLGRFGEASVDSLRWSEIVNKDM